MAGGTQASGRKLGALAVGMRADWIELDDQHPLLMERAGDALLDAWVFSGQGHAVKRVVCGGRVVVEDGRHVQAPAIRTEFARAMRRLLA